MAEPVVIGYNAIKFVQDANTRMVSLAATSNITNTGYDLEESAAGAAGATYTVPVGKQFILLWLRPILNGGATKEGFYINERYGATNYRKGQYGINAQADDTVLDKKDIECYFPFQAGSTVNLNTYAAGMSMHAFALGVETNV